MSADYEPISIDQAMWKATLVSIYERLAALKDAYKAMKQYRRVG